MSAFGQKDNNHNVRAGLRRSALERQCPKCQRKGALGREMKRQYGDVVVVERDCRYCGHTDVHAWNPASP